MNRVEITKCRPGQILLPAPNARAIAGSSSRIMTPLSTYISTIGNISLSEYTSPRSTSKSLMADTEHKTTIT